jgi:ribonuclease J
VLDIGLPLDRDGRDEPDVSLPPVRGFIEPDDSLLGVVISHPHQDHYGLASRLNDRVPFFIGAAAERILRTASLFTRNAVTLKQVVHLAPRNTLQVGPFRVTPYLVDHSAYDAYAILVEADGRRLFYSGDLRGHGRKARLFDALVTDPPQDIDVLLLEGTTVGRDDSDALCATEVELEQSLGDLMTEATGRLILFACSGQNIDRLVTLFKASRAAHRRLVLDMYTATILQATENKSLQWRNVGIFLPTSQKNTVKSRGLFHLCNRFKHQRVFLDRRTTDLSKTALLFRPSMMGDLDAQCGDRLNNVMLVYSMWRGYLKKDEWRATLRWLKSYEGTMQYCHTSGHAVVSDLKQFAKAINAGIVVPIHTDCPQQFCDLFRNVEVKEDGKWWDLRRQGL